MTDHLASAILFACFWNPSVNSVLINNNFVKGAFKQTAVKLFQVFPTKLSVLSFFGSITGSDTLEATIKNLNY